MPTSTKYSSREVAIRHGDESLHGKLFTPSPAAMEPLPALVCAHGFGSNYLSCVPYAWAFVELGFAVCCFDFCGGGYAVRSTGNPLDMTVATEAENIHAVVQAMCDLDEVDEERVFVLGEGQGGLAACLYGDDHPSECAGLVLVHPTLNLHDETRRLFPTKKNIPTSYRHLGMRVGRAFGEAAWDTNPYEHMQRFEGDVLIVHGDEDTSVPLDYSRRAANVFTYAWLEVVRHGRHAFKGATQEQCLDAVGTFLRAAM